VALIDREAPAALPLTSTATPWNPSTATPWNPGSSAF